MALADDLPHAWNHPAATATTRKRILRAVLEEIMVRSEAGQIHLKLHWKGGAHTCLEVKKGRAGEHRWKTSTTTEHLIEELARHLPDASIASVLNRLGMRSANRHTWTQLRIRNFRAERGIAIYRDGERTERGEVVLNEAAEQLGISKMTVVLLIKGKVLPAQQACRGAPYIIRRQDLGGPAVRRVASGGRAASPDPRQETLEYQ